MKPEPEKSNPAVERVWERGWDGHEQQQQQRLARLSLPEKIAWLEEAHRHVRQMAAKDAAATDSDK